MKPFKYRNPFIKSEELSIILNRLIKTYNPRTVFLFGSYVWGSPGPNSDIDFLVLLDKADASQPERIRRGLRALRGIAIPVDILVLTTQEIDTHKDHPSTLIYKVLRKGIKLYDAA